MVIDGSEQTTDNEYCNLLAFVASGGVAFPFFISFLIDDVIPCTVVSKP